MKKTNTKNIAYISLFAVMICLCGLITVPSSVPFTLQSFAVCISLIYLGGKRGTLSVLLYIFIGSLGLPVFSGGQGGFGILFGQTGGYIIGLVLIGVVYTLSEKFAENKKFIRHISLFVGHIVCYATGTLQFALIYSKKTGTASIWQILTICVLPFVIPDLIKIIIAVSLADKLKKITKNGVV